MTITTLAPFLPTDGRALMSEDAFIAVCDALGALRADNPLWRGLDDTPEHSARRCYRLIRARAHDPAIWLAVGIVEHRLGTDRDSVLWRNDTRSWTNARSVRDPGLRGWRIVRDSVRGSQYVAYAHVLDALADGMYRVTDPSYRYVLEGRATIGAVFAIWSEGDGAAYGARVVSLWNDWMGDTSTVGTSYDRVIRGLTDFRPYLRRNTRGGSEGRLPLNQKRGTVVHFNGPDVGPDDRAHVINVAAYHTTKDFSRAGDGSAIGDGIMYHVAVTDTGEKLLCRDLEDGLWHCGDTDWNRRALSLYLPIGINQRATRVQLDAARDVLDDWRAFTGESRASVVGHQELSSTNCPGSLMADLVLAYRATSEPQPDAPDMPGAQLDPWRFDNPYAAKWNNGQPFWVLDPFVAWQLARGGLMTLGHVVSGAFDVDGIVTQFYEGGALEWHPGNPPEHRVLRRHTGIETLRRIAPERVPA